MKEKKREWKGRTGKKEKRKGKYNIKNKNGKIGKRYKGKKEDRKIKEGRKRTKKKEKG